MVSIRLVKLPHQQQKFPTGVDNMFGGGGVMGGGGGRGGGGQWALDSIHEWSMGA